MHRPACAALCSRWCSMLSWRRLAAAACIGVALIALHGMTVRYDSYQGRIEPYFMARQWLYQRYYKNHQLFLGAFVGTGTLDASS